MRCKKNKYRFNLPRQTGKEKNRCRAGRFVRPKGIFKDCGGFEYIKAAVPYALDKGVTPIRLHGGFRRELP